MSDDKEQTQIMSRLRKPRPQEELVNDPGLPFQLWRLVGACEMAAHVLSMREDEEAKAIGVKLTGISDWFFIEAG